MSTLHITAKRSRKKSSHFQACYYVRHCRSVYVHIEDMTRAFSTKPVQFSSFAVAGNTVLRQYRSCTREGRTRALSPPLVLRIKRKQYGTQLKV